MPGGTASAIGSIAGLGTGIAGAAMWKDYDVNFYRRMLDSISSVWPDILRWQTAMAPRAAEAEGRMAESRLYGTGGTKGLMQLYQDVLSNADPMLSRLRTDAMADLELGGRLSPDVRREVMNNTLGNSILRGFAPGAREAYLTYAGLGQAGEGRRQQRRTWAAQLLPLMQSYTMPFVSQAYGSSQFMPDLFGTIYSKPPIPDNSVARGLMSIGGGMMGGAGGMMGGG